MSEIKNKRRLSRNRILESAETEFAEFGLAGARVDRIAERAGINKAMIYYHFSSKENLYRTIIRDQYEKIGDIAIKTADEGADFEAYFHEISKTLHMVFSPRGRFGKILMHELASGGRYLKEALSGGGSDGNFTSALGVPTLDGMGVVGDHPHAVDEYLVIDSIAERGAILGTLLRTWRL